MNTITSPLILTYRKEYKTNKYNDQSGEYVDKAIALELVEALERAKKYMIEFGCDDQLEFDRINNIIIKARGI